MKCPTCGENLIPDPFLPNMFTCPNNYHIGEANKMVTEEERDNFAIAFLVFASCDPRAKALLEARTPPGKVLDFYKDRAYLDNDTSKQ